jgi:hypothetical protein
VSIDFKLGQRCPHLVIEEPVALSSDRRSLRTTAPIGNTTLLRVLANNEYYIPPSGLYSQATLKGNLSGPFRIEGCITDAGVTVVDTNVVTVTSSTESRTFQLPIGPRIETDTLVRLFRESFTDIVVANDGGYLVFTDVARIGPESRITVTGRGAESIGFGFQKSARGKEIYPGWFLDKRDDILPAVNRRGQVLTTARFPKFVKPLRTNPTIKVTYVAPPNRCPRCNTTFVENDWRFDVVGDPILIQNEDILYQAALKIVLTVRTSNPFHPSYGSLISTRIGTKAIGATATIIREDVVTALQRMQELQKEQARYQPVALKERLFHILAVTVSPHRSDQTAFLVDVVVSNGTGEPVTLTTVFTVPGAIALAGSNGLSLGLDATGLSTAEARRLFR